MRFGILGIFLCSTLAVANDSAIKSLVQAENDFSNLSVKKGVNESFVTFFADDAIVLRPEPVNGKKWYQERKPSAGQLSWEPSLSEISASGDFGYNTGPWEFREKPDQEPTGFGQFFSFWKKQSNGTWKVLIDHGHGNPKPAEKAVLKTILPQKGEVSSNTKEEMKALLESDRKFSAVSKSQGTFEAYQQFLALRTRVMRAGQHPISDRKNALDMISKEKGTLTLNPAGANSSSAGDLGYTYGMSERVVDGKIEKGNYVRGWRKENGEWKLAVDLITPISE